MTIYTMLTIAIAFNTFAILLCNIGWWFALKAIRSTLKAHRMTFDRMVHVETQFAFVIAFLKEHPELAAEIEITRGPAPPPGSKPH